MKKYLSVLLIVLALAACSQNSRKPAAKQGAPSAAAAAPAQSGEAGQAQKAEGKVPEELAKLYKDLDFLVINLNTKEEITVKIPFNTPVKAEGTPFVITVLEFFPDFVMGSDGYGMRSTEPNNVAAKVNVVSAAQEFTGWLFMSYPDIHPFEHPEYKILLVSANKN